MGRPAKRAALDAFRDSLDDAEALVTYARAFENQRVRRMRRELRDRVGEALHISTKARDSMDCIENGDLFVVFRDANVLGRERFQDLRPLLRQSIVAGCAALETFIADKVMESISSALKAEALPKRLRDIPLTVGHWSDIERDYERRTWGIRGIVEDAVREQASTAPNQVGQVLGIVGVERWNKKVDSARKKAAGTTERELRELTERRNRIAHAADRVGQGRANLEIDEAEAYLSQIREIAEALDGVVDEHAI